MGNPNWITPQPFFDRVSAAWGPFGLDAAATQATLKANRDSLTRYIGPDRKNEQFRDALMCSWPDAINISVYPLRRVWCNPPYTNLIGWTKKSAEESDKGLKVVMLLPWSQWAEWMEFTAARAEIVRVVGRIKFIDPTEGNRECPMGMNILAIFRPPVEGVKWPVGFTGASIQA